VDDECFERLTAIIHHTLPENANDVLDAPVTLHELRRAVKKGKPNKELGADGMRQDFLKDAWEIIHPELLAILQQMHTEGMITDTQKHGMMICFPKIQRPTGPGDYRILTLLNADIKAMARITANHLGLGPPSIIHTSQHCGVRGHTTFDAVATVHEAIAHAEQALCILSHEFQATFDNISHQYLFQILERYRFSARFQRRIRNIYENATSFTSMDTLRAPFW
jgi:hypothetical protein